MSQTTLYSSRACFGTLNNIASRGHQPFFSVNPAATWTHASKKTSFFSVDAANCIVCRRHEC